VGAASRPAGLPRYALVPSTPGWLGHNRGEPLMILDYITVNILQAGPVELLACPQIKLHHPTFPPPGSRPPPGPPAIPGCGWPPPLPPVGDRKKRWLPRGTRAICAVPCRSARWVPCPPRSPASRGEYRAKAGAARWG
jgi:hypothetical protein